MRLVNKVRSKNVAVDFGLQCQVNTILYKNKHRSVTNLSMDFKWIVNRY